MIGHLRLANPDYRHPYLTERPVKSVGLVIVSTDRGLCGGLNVNVFKQAINEIRQYEEQGIAVELCLIGSKAQQFFRRLKYPISATITHLGDKPHAAALIGAVKVMLDAYVEGRIDKLSIVHAEFINTMSQKPLTRQLLPAEPVKSSELQDMWDYIYEPSAAELLEGFMARYIESQVYLGAVENVA